MFSLRKILILLLVALASAQAFTTRPPVSALKNSPALHNVVGDLLEDAVEGVENIAKRDQLKRRILQLGASYDRGFGASPTSRTKVDDVIFQLESLNQEQNASRFIDGPGTVDNDSNSTKCTSPLAGNWRMVWTSAQDVLLLGANPLVSVGAIYQLFDPPVVTNVIDFFPRMQLLLPPAVIQSSLLRAKVETRGSSRANKPMRVGLVFERVALNPIELLGRDVSKDLSPLKFGLPKFEVSEDVGYFDVTFLDADMLIIRQNAPGGVFVLSKVDDIDP
jgi:hypothetical protein